MRRDNLTSNSERLAPNYPILIGAGFLLVSVLLYWFNFPKARNELVLVFMFLCIFSLLLGSVLGTKSKLKLRVARRIKPWWLWLAVLMLVVNATVNITAFYSSLNDILVFLWEPGEAYEHVKFLTRHGQENEGLFGGVYGPLITMLAFSKYVVFGWAVLYWSDLSKSLKVAAVVSLLYYAAQAFLIGAMVNVATVVISSLVVFVAKGAALRSKRRRILRWGALASGVCFVILSFFRGSREVGVTGVSERILVGAEGLVSYVSQGYIGLGYSLEQSFIFTGGSTAFYGIARLFNDGLSPDSYLARSEVANGWSASQLWSTAAPWLASDLTFVGVPILLLFVGVCSGRLWKISLTKLDPFALLLLGQLSVGIFFFPANNHLFQTFANSSTFVIIILLYLFMPNPSVRTQSSMP